MLNFLSVSLARRLIFCLVLAWFNMLPRVESAFDSTFDTRKTINDAHTTEQTLPLSSCP